MQYSEYNECVQRGTIDFPLQLYQVEESFPRYHMNWHWHREYEIIRILEGEFLVTLDEKELLAKKGDTLFINSGTLHKGIPSPGCYYECIVFDLSMLSGQGLSNEIIGRLLNHHYSISSYFASGNLEIHRLIWSLFEAMIQRPFGYHLTVRGCLLHFLGICFHQGYYATDTLQPARIKKRILSLKHVLELIEKDYASALTLEELSKAAGMSPKYFCRFFKEMTQKTPMDYLNFYRIEQACQMMNHTDLPVTEIAYNCGFNDLSYFIKTFKRYKNITPKKYMSTI